METALKEQIKRRNELLKTIAIEALNGRNQSKYAQMLCNDISTAVANAIVPINDLSAIYIIAILKGYVNSLSEDHPDAAKAADRLLKKCVSAVLNIPIKEEE